MSYFIAGLGASLGKRTIANPGTPPPPPGGAQTFAQWLASTNTNAGPAHYWSMDDGTGATMFADTGGLNGTYVNLGGLEFEITDAASIKNVGFRGTNGHVTIPTPVTTAAFTLMWRLQVDIGPSQMTLATTGFQSTPGQFLIQLENDGAGGHKPRVGSKNGAGASVIYVGTGAGSCPIGTVYYFFYIRAANGTQEVWIVDVAAGTASQIPLTLDVGTAPGSWSAPPAGDVVFFTATTLATSFDGVACRMALWDIAIPRTDITALAEIVPADEPVVVWARDLDAGTVDEDGAVLSDVPVTGHIHPATGFTVSVINDGTLGTLTTDGTDLTYTSGATPGTETAASWRIAKDGVNSPTVGFDVVVESAGAPPESAQANCFIVSGANTVVVNSMADMAAAVNAAPAGRQILIAAGTYAGGTHTFNRDGTAANPIVVRPQGALGTVTIDNARWTYDAGCSHLVLSSLYFNGARITFQGSFNRITRCRFRQINTECILPDVLTDSRIDHCDFSDYDVGNPATRCCIRFRNGPFGAGTTKRILVDYCYFHDIFSTVGVSNPMLVPQASTADACTANAEIVIDHCLFENIDRAGSQQDIDIKCSDVTVRFCSFVGGGNSTLQMRKGNNCEFRSNWFENISSRPIGIHGNNHLVIGNRIVGSGKTMWISSGDEPALACNTGGYAPASNCRVIGNIVDGDLDVGRLPDSLTKTHKATNNTIQAHTGTIDTSTDSAWHTGTVINSTTSEPYVPAVKLTAGAVGLNAADPLCN